MKIKKDKKIKTISLKKAKQLAWNAFSKYIRLSSLKWGMYGICYTCDTKTHFNNLQAGHWVEGHSNMTYINEDYVRVQCKTCNLFHGGRQGEFRDRIRQEIGDKRTENLLFQSKQVRELTQEDYQALEEKYKKKIRELK